MKNPNALKASFEERITLEYAPLTWFGPAYGTLIFFGGIILSILWVRSIVHHAQNLGTIQPGFVHAYNAFMCGYAECTANEVGISTFMWLAFGIVAIGVTLAGIALFFWRRITTYTKDGTVTVSHFSGAFKKRLRQSDIRYLAVSPRPVVAVYGVGLGGAVRTSSLGVRYAVVLRRVHRSHSTIVALYDTREEAEDMLDTLRMRCKTTKPPDTMYIDVLTGDKKKYEKDARVLYELLHAVWEREVEHLMPSGHSYTESWESVPYVIDASIDIDQLCDRLYWSEHRLLRALDTLKKDKVAYLK